MNSSPVIINLSQDKIEIIEKITEDRSKFLSDATEAFIKDNIRKIFFPQIEDVISYKGDGYKFSYDISGNMLIDAKGANIIISMRESNNAKEYAFIMRDAHDVNALPVIFVFGMEKFSIQWPAWHVVFKNGRHVEFDYFSGAQRAQVIMDAINEVSEMLSGKADLVSKASE